MHLHLQSRCCHQSACNLALPGIAEALLLRDVQQRGEEFWVARVGSRSGSVFFVNFRTHASGCS